MSMLNKFAWLALMPALLALVLVACGGDDDKGDDDSGTNSPVENNDDNSNSNDDSNDDSNSNDDSKSEDDDKNSSSGGSDPRDKAYVADICKAANEYFAGFTTAFEELDPEDPDAFLEALKDPFEGFANALDDADPPSDLEDWHNQTVDALRQTVDAIESGDAAALEEGGGPEFPDMPAGAQERLSTIAEDNEDCQALAEDGENIFE